MSAHVGVVAAPNETGEMEFDTRFITRQQERNRKKKLKKKAAKQRKREERTKLNSDSESAATDSGYNESDRNRSTPKEDFPVFELTGPFERFKVGLCLN